LPSSCLGLNFYLRHPAIEPGETWGVGHGTGNGIARGGSGDRSRIRFTSRVTGLRPTGLVTVGAAALIWLHQRTCRPPVSEGDLAFSGRSSATLGRWVSPTEDPTQVEIRLDDPGRADQIRIVTDRPGQPVDVRRFESGDLAQGVVVEFSERHRRCRRLRERRSRWPSEPAEAAANERTGRGRRPGRLPSDHVGSPRWLPSQRRRRTAAGYRLIPDAECLGRIDPSGHGPSRLRLRGTTLTPRDVGLEWSAAPLASGPIVGSGSPPRQRGIRVVDLGHPARGEP
jgi:hypothetical protein